MSASFKQRCPSCEAMVPVKDSGMIGKNVECPKCKDQFVVTKPAVQSEDEEELQLAGAHSAQTPNMLKQGASAKKPASTAVQGPGALAHAPASTHQDHSVTKRPTPSGNGKHPANGSEAPARPGLAKKTVLHMPAEDSEEGSTDSSSPSGKHSEEANNLEFLAAFQKLAEAISFLDKCGPLNAPKLKVLHKLLGSDAEPARLVISEIHNRLTGQHLEDFGARRVKLPTEDLSQLGSLLKTLFHQTFETLKQQFLEIIGEQARTSDGARAALTILENLTPEVVVNLQAYSTKTVKEEAAPETRIKPAPKTKPGSVKKPATPVEEEAENGAEAPSKPAPKTKPGAPKKTAPPVEEEEAEDEEEAPLKPAPKTKPGVPKKPAAPAKEEEAEDEDEAPLKPAPKTKHVAPKKTSVKHPVEDEEAEETSAETAEDKPKGRFAALSLYLARFKLNELNFRSKKAMIGVGLVVVAVVSLAVAAYVIHRGRQQPIATGGPLPLPTGDGTKKIQPGDTSSTSGKGIVKNTQSGVSLPPVNDPQIGSSVQSTPPRHFKLAPAGPEMTNCLPPGTEQVTHLSFKNLLDPACPFRLASFDSDLASTIGVLSDDAFKRKLGFWVLGEVSKGKDPVGIDEIILAERFTLPAWSFSVVHVMDKIYYTNLFTSLGGLQPQPEISGQKYYQVSDLASPWVEQLGKLGIGVPPSIRHLQTRPEKRKIFVHFLPDEQTVIFADEAPLKDFLTAKGHFKFFESKPGSPEDRTKPFMTIDRVLRETLLYSFKEKEDDATKVLFRSATNLLAAKTSGVLPNQRGLVLYRPRSFWDVTCMLEERDEKRLKTLGCRLIQKDSTFKYENTIKCQEINEAKKLCDEINGKFKPRLETFIKMFVNGQARIGVPDAVQNISINAFQTIDRVNMVMDLSLHQVEGIKKVTDLLKGLLLDMQDELVVAEERSLRNHLAKAVFEMRTGNPSRGLKKVEGFPPGLLPAPPGMKNDPSLRISWMAKLLPYLGHSDIFEKIDQNKYWNDPANWMAGRTLIAQFIDSRYADKLRYVQHPLIPEELAATHFVAIAGVGLDAADLPLNDPSTDSRRGITGYDQSASFDDVAKGRGLANTIYLIEVPPDAMYGVSPWIAGGGNTIRGLPEKNSLAPFVGKDPVQSNDRANGRRGAYAIMADGSIRFITAEVSDQTFQTMCTYHLPNPPNFNIDTDPRIIKIADPPAAPKGPR